MSNYVDPGAAAAVLTMTLALVGLVVPLELHHRRTTRLPHAAFGADAGRDADLARVRCELSSARTRAEEPSAQSSAQSSGSSTRASQVARRSTAVSNSGWVSVNS